MSERKERDEAGIEALAAERRRRQTEALVSYSKSRLPDGIETKAVRIAATPEALEWFQKLGANKGPNKARARGAIIEEAYRRSKE